jgi:ferredoxin-thioredoxin reductase catalytic subunit
MIQYTSGNYVSNKIPEEHITWARRMTSRYAERGPYLLHPDEVTVRNVVEGLAKNRAKYGRAYCPCRPVEGDPDKDVVNICPCRSHHRDIASDGTCECGIFVSERFYADFRSHERT